MQMQGYDPIGSIEDDEPSEILLVRIRGQTKAGNTGIKICYRSHDEKKKQMRPSSDNWKMPFICRPWSS